MMHIARKSTFTLMLTSIFLSGAAPGQAQQDSSAIDLAQKQITGYLSQLADVHCTETVTQQKLTENGHVEASEKEKFDYLIMMGGNGDDFQLNESRVEANGEKHKLQSMPMLVTNGMSTVLLVFHPYYRDGFTFETGAEERFEGRTAVPIHFTHISGRRTPAALALRGREYPLDLEGTAWLDKQSGQILKADAALMHDMSDVGLRSLSVHVEYKPISLEANKAEVAMPSVAVVDVTTPRQHWRNTHQFENYRGFSTDVEQDPNVKVRNDNNTASGTEPAHSSATIPAGAKETH